MGKRFLRNVLTLSILPLICTMILLCNFSEAADGKVVLVDGMNPATIVMNDQSPTDYLYSTISNDWRRTISDEIGPIQPYYWANNPILETISSDAIESLTNILRQISDKNKTTFAPLIIVSHSWGTVLTYIVLKKNPDIIVDKLITMGSPLKAQNYFVWDLTYTALNFNLIFNIESLPNIKVWHNYWTVCDWISGSIPASENYYVASSGEDIHACHSSYYKDAQTWDFILTDVLYTPYQLSISTDPSYPSAPANITFNAKGWRTNDITASYQWDFGDGQSGNGKTVSHYFKQPNNYTVQLTMTDADGPHVLTETVTVRQPQITVTYPHGFDDLYRHFSTPEISGIQSYVWNFGDGVIRTDDDNTTSHTYTTPDYYTVTLTLTLNDDTTIQSQKGFFVGPGAIIVPGHTIYDDEVWENDGTYVVQGNITVAQGGSLTIKPGVEVKMCSECQITVYGTLSAVGTSFNKVTFTRDDGVNQWNGIWFSGSGATNSRLENCVIEHAGGAKVPYIRRGILSLINSSPTITGCTISESDAFLGITVDNGSPIISNNIISGMGFGVFVEGNSYPTVTGNAISYATTTGISTVSGGTYQGNSLSFNRYGIGVIYSTGNPAISDNTYSNNTEADLSISGTITSEVNWDETDILYKIQGVTISQGARLIIAPGITVKLTNGSLILVYGTLTATGVNFTWADEGLEWRGIWFHGAGSTNSRLKDCEIEHANGVSKAGYKGIISIINSSPTITGNTINNSSADYVHSGIWIESGAPEISNNIISGMSYGIYAYYSTNNPVISGNTYLNNTEADLSISGTITSEVNWDETGGIVYEIRDDLEIAQGASLNISSGTTVIDINAPITVYGTFTASEVTFLAGIRFSGAGSSGSRLENCSVGSLSIQDSSPTIIGCMSRGISIDNGSPVITNNVIDGMHGYGIYVRSNSSPMVTGNTINGSQTGIYVDSNNGTYQNNIISGGQYGIYANFPTSNPVISGNTYSNNTIADLNVSGTINSAMNWDETGAFVYRIGNLKIAEGASLNIAPGRTVKLTSDAQITVYGTLTATGVRFIWANGVTQWGGIGFIGLGSTNSRMEDCIIEHASGYYDNQDGIVYIRGIVYIVNSSPTIAGCTINNSLASYGIYIDNGSPVITNNTISGMSSFGLYVFNNSSPTVTGNTIVGSQYGIYIQGDSSGAYQGNTLSSNQYGIYASYGTNNPMISGNTYLNNTAADLSVGGPIITTSIIYSADDIQIPQTGQKKCYDELNDEISCSGTGQDGEIRAGVPWPDQRFTIGHGAEADCVTDNLTGLMWPRDGNLSNGTMDWNAAIDYANDLNLCGYSDWRLPNVNELESLINADVSNTATWLNTQGFYNVQLDSYWSSTTSASHVYGAWIVSMDGYVFFYDKDGYYSLYVWPVRSGQSGTIKGPETGQKISFREGDDGDLARGGVMSDQRFNDNGNGIVTDNLTGLVWLKNANCINTNYPGFDNDSTSTYGPPYDTSGYGNGTVTWQHALDFVAGINNGAYPDCGAGDSDWRLPNTEELRSLIDYSRYYPALPAGYPFTNVKDIYWTSNSSYDDWSYYCSGGAWIVDISFGNVYSDCKGEYYNDHFEGDNVINHYVWPVRSGQVGESYNYFCDADSDGHISSTLSGTCRGTACQPAGCLTVPGDDCNDNDLAIHPDTPETCNDLDDNCDGTIDEGFDADGDTVADCFDNCSDTPNPLQEDTDDDGYGNICDADLDNDGFVGPNDYNIFGMAWWSDSSSPNWNPDADFDSDGFVGPNDYNLLGMRWWTVGPWK